MFPLNAQISTNFIHFTVDNIFPKLLTYMGIHCDAVKCAKIQYHTLHVIVGFFLSFFIRILLGNGYDDYRTEQTK